MESFAGANYVEGGLVNLLVTDVARRYGADMVSAVDITSSIYATVLASRMEVLIKSIEIIYNKGFPDSHKQGRRCNQTSS
jgi:predicted acylesterase/phospholipase RssA